MWFARWDWLGGDPVDHLGSARGGPLGNVNCVTTVSQDEMRRGQGG